MVSNIKCTLISCILVSALFMIISYAVFHMYDRNIYLHNIVTRLSPYQNLDINISKYSIAFSQDFIRNEVNDAQKLFHAHWFRIIKHYIPLPLETSYGSHKLALLAASILTAQHVTPVMEMGCGYHSTVLLHRIIVEEQKRFLLSTDTDREWLSKFETDMLSSLHQFRHISQTSEWDDVGLDQPRWSIVFIDHKPGERRVIDIIRLANVSDIVIVHDTEAASYNYEPGLSQYPYRYRYKYLSTHTDVLSKYNETLLQNIQYLLEAAMIMNLPKL